MTFVFLNQVMTYTKEHSFSYENKLSIFDASSSLDMIQSNSVFGFWTDS